MLKVGKHGSCLGAPEVLPASLLVQFQVSLVLGFQGARLGLKTVQGIVFFLHQAACCLALGYDGAGGLRDSAGVRGQ